MVVIVQVSSFIEPTGHIEMHNRIVPLIQILPTCAGWTDSSLALAGQPRPVCISVPRPCKHSLTGTKQLAVALMSPVYR